MRIFFRHVGLYILNLLMILGIIALFFNESAAQTPIKSNQRIVKIAPVEGPILLDSATVAVQTFELSDGSKDVDSSYFTIDNNLLVFKNLDSLSFTADSLTATFQVYPYNFESTLSRLDSTQLSYPDRVVYIEYDVSPDPATNSQRLLSNDLQYDGSFTRGFSFGNNQSLVLNSNFNLQLAGDLGDGMSVKAAISDDNLPIQAEGTTQQLQEFDKVFIQIDRGSTSIIAGDYDLKRPKSYFQNYYKKLKGLQIRSEREMGTKVLSTSGNFAISRGEFSRNFLEIQEGNQGPYRLRGADGVRIQKVLSGTEKVYLDGRLLTRGLEEDYVIFYDRSEILFTHKVLMTKDSRIIVEFEYATQNYLRSQYGTQVSLESKKYDLNFNFYTEQDSKTATGDIDLDTTDLAILREVGDRLDLANRPAIRIADIEGEFAEQVRYAIEYLPNGDSILVYSADPEVAKYTATFSDVGIGNGSYSIDSQAAANGRAYKWVGSGNGRYEPIIQLVAPELKQMISLGGEYRHSPHLVTRGEIAISNNDINRFSQQGNTDNVGVGLNLGLSYQHNLYQDSSRLSYLLTSLNTEYINQKFNPLNPYRVAEFARDWNLPTTQRTSETIWTGGVAYQYDQKNSLSYNLKRFDKADIYNGNKHLLQARMDKRGWDLDGKISHLSSDGFGEKTAFFRTNIELAKTVQALGGWKIGVYHESEDNKRSNNTTETLTTDSRKYRYVKSFIESPYHSKFRFRIGLNQRNDWRINSGIFERVSVANEMEIDGKWQQSESSLLNYNFIIRSLNILNTQLITDTPKTSYLGRLDYNVQLLNGAVRSSTSYFLNSGQEAKSEFEFIKVLPGEGQYIWLDDGDGVEEVQEFQIAPLQDTASYLRITIFNSEFIRTNSNSINQSTRIEGRNLWSKEKRDKHPLYHGLSKLSLISNIRLNQKNEDSNNEGFDPWRFSLRDSSLVSHNAGINNTLFFNRGNPTYDLQIGQRRNVNRFVQITGYEHASLTEYFYRIRYNFNRGLDLVLEYNRGNKFSDSENFDLNDYDIRTNNLIPKLTYRPNPKLRIIGSYTFNKRKNQIGNDEQSTSHDFTLESTVRSSNKSNFNLNLSYVDVDYTGEKNGAIELAMLDGLKNGKNLLWGSSFIKRISKNVDMIINYDGRKTGESKTVHTARAQVKATF